jgi:uncharacterized protein
VDGLFAPPGNDWQPVSPKLVTERRVVLAVVWFAVTTLVLVLVGLLGAPTWVLLMLGALALAVLAWGWVVVGRSARSWAYAEREEDLYIKHGVMFRRLVSVPYGRMQYVDVHAGPLDQAWGIANVHLHTAAPGTSAVIPGLPAEEAARLRDRLTSLGEAQAAGL